MARKGKPGSLWAACWRKVKYVLVVFLCFSIGTTVLFRFINPPGTPLMVERYVERKEAGVKGPLRHHWVPLEQISPQLVRAVIASEDNLYLHHFGFDFAAMKRAIVHNRTSKRKFGASTISQQTAKNVFLWPGRTYLRKGLESYFTLLIETFWRKRRIMEVYLNMIEMGPGIFGAEAASEYYFHRPAAHLTASQAAMLASCLPSPRTRNPKHPTYYMVRRQHQILDLMPKMGKIDL